MSRNVFLNNIDTTEAQTRVAGNVQGLGLLGHPIAGTLIDNQGAWTNTFATTSELMYRTALNPQDVGYFTSGEFESFLTSLTPGTLNTYDDFSQAFQDYIQNVIGRTPDPNLNSYLLKALSTDVSRFLASQDLGVKSISPGGVLSQIHYEADVDDGVNALEVGGVRGLDLFYYNGTGDTSTAAPLAKTAFGSFLRSVTDNATFASSSAFFEKYLTFFKATALLQHQSRENIVSTFGTQGTSPLISYNTLDPRGGGQFPGFMFAAILSYEAVYHEITGKDEAAFWADLNTWVEDVVKEETYFIPSHFMDDWIAHVQAKQYPDRDRLLFVILDLLIESLEALQLATTRQSERIGYLADVQKLYTDVTGKIYYMTEERLAKDKSQADAIYKTEAIPERLLTKEGRFSTKRDEDKETNRQGVNSDMQGYAENLRAHRSNVKDRSRQAQATMNALNDSVSQQSNMSSSILQLLGGLLQAIFR